MTDAVLRPPAARQGPGRMPTALVDALDLVVARHAAGALPGDRRAAGMGAGTELAQLRPYEVGDDVRQIDAAATARTGEPHVRLHVPERTLTTWIVLDVSPSMAFGTAQRLKADVAEGVALVLGNLAVRRAGRVAMMTFGAGRPRLLPPRGSRPGVVAAAPGPGRGRRARRRQRAARAGPCAGSRRAGRAPARLRRRHLRLPRAARLDARARRPRARATPCWPSRSATRARPSCPPSAAWPSSTPRRASALEVDTSRPRVRERFAALERERREGVARELRRLHVDHVALSTDRDWLLDLGRRLR